MKSKYYKKLKDGTLWSVPDTLLEELERLDKKIMEEGKNSTLTETQQKISDICDNSEDYDIIEKPKHYNIGIETDTYIESWKMTYREGNIVKYITRYKYKNGLQDLKKAQWYLTKLIEKHSEIKE